MPCGATSKERLTAVVRYTTGKRVLYCYSHDQLGSGITLDHTMTLPLSPFGFAFPLGGGGRFEATVGLEASGLAAPAGLDAGDVAAAVARSPEFPS